jgi:23S rRNA (guanine745-N1)-methyltransferase
MVRAREEFLATGKYEPIAAALSTAVVAAPADRPGENSPPVVAEIGCGTGYYLDAVLRALIDEARPPRRAVGLDLSKPAIDRAARHHTSFRFAVTDVEERIPLGDSTADLVISAFAPRPAGELARVTKSGGSLVVALAGPGHLERLRARLDLLDVPGDKLDKLCERLAPWFDLEETAEVDYEIELTAEEARALVLMGPNAWHGFDETALTGDLSERVSVVIATFRCRS